MNFIDKVVISVKAGKGGDGRVSFRHEKFIAKGGPDGGDGGDGGDIVLVASRNQDTLARFRYQKELIAESGEAGGKSRKHGKNGQDLFVQVPVGTLASLEDGTLLADLTEDGQRAVIAHGGRGGFGNAHFVSSRRQAPHFSEKGEEGQAYKVSLELKMIADVGLVGLPNAGKSTLLSRISNARPEVADYPFTTLTPNLGVVDIDEETSVLFADIPGLIEGASQGKGLGHEFLRHIERTSVLVHLVDAYQQDVVDAYRTVRAELKAYDPLLIERPELIVLNKVEGLEEKKIHALLASLRRAAPEQAGLFAVSAQTGAGVNQVLYAVKQAVLAERSKQDVITEPDEFVPVLTMNGMQEKWQVEKRGDSYVVSGERIEQFARRTDFNNSEGVQRLRDIMKRMGIFHELVRQGINPGDKIEIHGAGSISY